MNWLVDPLSADFMQRALVVGVLVGAICAVVGTWVVIRGMAFLGEAIGHGLLPGVALATATGVPVMIGGALAAMLMSTLITLLARQGRLSYDTSVGLLFVAMLALGVIAMSHSDDHEHEHDATAVLFGDILAVGRSDLIVLAVALALTLATAAIFHRSFVAATFDRRIAATLDLRPMRAQVVLVGLVTLAVLASFQAVGSLLVLGLLLAPAVAARCWITKIRPAMALAAGFAAAAVVCGLLISWHFATAAGATIALCTVALAALSGISRALVERASLAQPQPGATMSSASTK